MGFKFRWRMGFPSMPPLTVRSIPRPRPTTCTMSFSVMAAVAVVRPAQSIFLAVMVAVKMSMAFTTASGVAGFPSATLFPFVILARIILFSDLTAL